MLNKKNNFRRLTTVLILTVAVGWWFLRRDNPQPATTEDASLSSTPLSVEGTPTHRASDLPLNAHGLADNHHHALHRHDHGTAESKDISAFGQWLTDYTDEPDHITAPFLARGIELASARRAAMKQLIQEDPETALQLALSEEEIQSLPAGIRGLMETPVSGLGDFGVMIVENHETHEGHIEREVVLENRRFDAFVYGNRLSQSSLRNVPLHGIAIDDLMAVHEEALKVAGSNPAAGKNELCAYDAFGAHPAIQPVRLLEGSRLITACKDHVEELNRAWAAYDGNGGGGTSGGDVAMDSWSQGPKTMLFIRVNFPDDLEEPISESGAVTLMENVSDWFYENSYGTTSFTTDVTPLVTLPHTKSHYQEVGDGQLLQDARTAARDAGYDTSNYDFDAVRFKSIQGFSYSGKAYVRGKGCWLQSSSVGVACHEFGHNMGLWHANFWQASEDSVIGHGSHKEYGDIFDTMGSASAGDKQFNASQKNKIDWLGDPFIRDIQNSGTFRLHAFDVPALESGNSYALKIRRDFDRDYWVELRNGFASNPYIQNGVLIHWDPWTESGSGTHLIDTTPGTPTGSGGKEDAALVVGRTFSDSGAGIHITPISIQGTGNDRSVDVVVNIGSFPGNNVPTVSLTASASQAATGEALIFTAVATDPDNDSLAFDWDFHDKSFGPNQAVVTNSWSSSGHYVVRCRVSDMKGGTASAQMVVTIGNPSTHTISGRVTDDTGQPLEGVRVHNGKTGNSYRGGYTDSDGQYSIGKLSSGEYGFGAVGYGFNLSESGGWNSPFTISDDTTDADYAGSPVPAVHLEIIDADVAEEGENPGTVRLVREGDTASALTVYFYRSGNASSSSDYTLLPDASGSAPHPITIPAGESHVDWTIEPIDDTGNEGPETVVLLLAEHADYRIAHTAQVELVIEDNETPALPYIYSSSSASSADNLATENGNDTGGFTISRTGNKTAEVLVEYSIGGSATPGVDYEALPGSVVIPAGETSVSIFFRAIDDFLVEGDETVELSIADSESYNKSSSTSQVIIQDNDRSVVSVTAVESSASEDGAPGRFRISRAGETTDDLAVAFQVNGTASLPGDFTMAVSPAVIPAGESEIDIVITPVDDPEVETEETIRLTLLDAPGSQIGAPNSAEITIADNDEPAPKPVVTLSVMDEASTEGLSDPFVLRIHRGTNTSGALTVNLLYNDSTTPPSDLEDGRSSITIPDGEETVEVSMQAASDAESEGIERLEIQIAMSEDYEVANAGPVEVILLDAPFNNWQLGFFAPEQISDPNLIDPSADPDLDGRNNFTEYAVHSDPMTADASPVFRTELEPIPNSDESFLVVHYRRRINAPDVRYELSFAESLENWVSDEAFFEEIESVPDANGATESVTTRLLLPTSHGLQQFVTLRIIRE